MSHVVHHSDRPSQKLIIRIYKYTFRGLRCCIIPLQKKGSSDPSVRIPHTMCIVCGALKLASVCEFVCGISRSFPGMRTFKAI